MGDIEDIEDLSLDAEELRAGQKPQVRYSVPIKNFKRAQKKEEEEEIKPSEVIPGTETVYVKTWGCSHNNSDGEYMAGQLASFGYKITENPEEADLWVLNSCTVKNPSQQSFVNTINKAKEGGKKIVLAGCVPQGQKDDFEEFSSIGVQQIDRVVEVVEETLKGHKVKIMGQKKEDGKRLGGASLNLPKIRKNPLIEIIPINTGCLNHCTYCKTKHARGDLASYPPEEIVERVRSVIQEGVIEIWLTSEDTGTYGRDIGSSLPELLWAIVNILPSHVMLRLGMTNPPYILEHLSEVAKILNHSQVYAFLHIPVQAGSDKVLNLMRREYTNQDFCDVVDFLRKEVPGISIATDVICGFPGETEEDFSETIQLIEKYKFPSLFISQFYPRPGTPAARMERVPTLEVKKRSRVVTQLFESYSTYSGEEGKVFLVSVTQMTDDGKQYVSHDKFYRQVLIDRQENGPELFGKRCHVKIREAGKHYLLADLVEIVPYEAAVIINLPKKAPKKIQKSKAKDQQQPKREGNEEEEEEEEEKELNEDSHDNYDRNHHHQHQDQENQEKNDQGWCSNDCEGEGCGDGCECSPGKGKEKQEEKGVEKGEEKGEEKEVRPPFPESILYDLEQETEGEKARRELKDRVDPFPKKESMRKKNSLTKAHYGGFVVALILSVLLAGNFFTDYMPI